MTFFALFELYFERIDRKLTFSTPKAITKLVFWKIKMVLYSGGPGGTNKPK